MKKIVLFVCLLFVLQGQAQSKSMFGKNPLINLENWDQQRVYWGYFLGFNSYTFKFDYKIPGKDVLSDNVTGFNVGMIGDLRLAENLNLRFEPGLYYTQRNLTFPNFINPVDALREVRSTYIHFPLLLKYSAVRTGNVRPYLLGGLSRTLNLSSNSKSKTDNLEQRFRMKQWSNNYEIGFGIDIYFEYFKFSPSIRGVFGLENELIHDNDPNSPWTGNIESMKTRAILINFAFH